MEYDLACSLHSLFLNTSAANNLTPHPGSCVYPAVRPEQEPFLKLHCKRGATVRKCNQHIIEALELARMLTILADEGEIDAEDDSCSVLYCIIRDAAYKIRLQAENEREAHQKHGIWDEPEQPVTWIRKELRETIV